MVIKKATNTLNRIAVTAYKLLGFAALSLILFGLAAYVIINLFYMVDKNWIAPVILTPHHERVIKLNSELAEQRFQRNKLDAERLTLEIERRHIDRALRAGENFQAGFVRALEADQRTREQELANLRDVYRDYRRNGQDIRDSLDAFADITRERTQDDFDSNLIDRQTWLERNYLLSQVSTAELQLQQTQVELLAQTRLLERQVDSVESLRSEIGSEQHLDSGNGFVANGNGHHENGNGHHANGNGHSANGNGNGHSANGNGNGHSANGNGNGNGHHENGNGDSANGDSSAGDEPAELSYDVLLMEREYRQSHLELDRLRDERLVLDQQLAVIDQTAAEFDRILAAIQSSAYLRAMDEQLEIAFVPYDNLEKVEPGNPVYACSLGLLFCDEVGEIVQILDGEVAGRHPLHNRDLRGVMVELHLTDPTCAEHATLHVNRPPFFF